MGSRSPFSVEETRTYVPLLLHQRYYHEASCYDIDLNTGYWKVSHLSLIYPVSKSNLRPASSNDSQESKVTAATVAREKEKRQPRYMANLLKQAKVRALESDRIFERKLQKEREEQDKVRYTVPRFLPRIV